MNLAQNTLTTKGEDISMSESQAKYHKLNSPNEVTDATSYKKYTREKLWIVLKIEELMTKWNKATFKEKLVIMASLVLLIVIAVCFVLMFEISTTGKEGR